MKHHLLACGWGVVSLTLIVNITAFEASADDFSFNSQEIIPIIEPKDLSSEIPTFMVQGSSGVVGDTFSEGNIRQLREDLLIDPLSRDRLPFPPTPASTLGVPTAYGANWGNAYVGAAFASANRLNGDADGSLSLGIGFGNAREVVGLEVALGIISLQDSFGSDGVVGFKLHRILDEKGYFAAAVGWENLIKWGNAGDDIFRGSSKDTLFGVFTGRFDLQPENLANQLPLTISVGLGSGRFRSKGAIDASEQNVNLFATAGLRVIPQVSLISTWTGQELNLGTSIAPFANIPLIINLGAADVTGVFPQGTRFVMTAGYAIEF